MVISRVHIQDGLDGSYAFSRLMHRLVGLSGSLRKSSATQVSLLLVTRMLLIIGMVCQGLEQMREENQLLECLTDIACPLLLESLGLIVAALVA